jgi:hypothetical protein
MKRKWIKALVMVTLAWSSFAGPMNPKEIEDLLHITNETKIEFTIPDQDYKGDGLQDQDWTRGRSRSLIARLNHRKFIAVRTRTRLSECSRQC